MSKRMWGKTKVQKRSKVAMDREAWKGIVEQARTHRAPREGEE